MSMGLFSGRDVECMTAEQRNSTLFIGIGEDEIVSAIDHLLKNENLSTNAREMLLSLKQMHEWFEGMLIDAVEPHLDALYDAVDGEINKIIGEDVKANE